MPEIKTLKSKEPYGSNCYLISSGTEYAVIDPSVSYEDAVMQCDIPAEGLKYVIVTHAHFDHILKIDSWVNKGAVVLVGKEDKPSLSDSYKNCYSVFFGVNKGYSGDATELSNNDIIYLGEEQIKIISTPGHTPGGIALLCGGILFSGDTIFDEGYGRYDLPGGNPQVLYKTIKSLLELPADTVVYSGHGEPSTIGRIKKYLNF